MPAGTKVKLARKPVPKVRIMVRTSERKDFAWCRYNWFWGYVDRLKPKATKPALKFGDLIHQALAIYYPPGKVRGPNPADTLIDLWESHAENLVWVYTEEDERENALDLGVEMLNGYVEWAAPLDGQYEIIAPEQGFQVDVFDDKGNYLFTYVGTLDAIIREIRTKRIGFMEHKTTRSLPIDLFLPLDEQGGSYWTFAPEWLRAQKILKPGEDMDFILYNELKKSRPDLRPKNEHGESLNQNGTVSKRQPKPLFNREIIYRNAHARQMTKDRVIDQVAEMFKVRAGEMALLKSPSKDCKFCPYKEMCELHENGADWEGYRDAMFEKWEPYEIHLDIPTEATR